MENLVQQWNPLPAELFRNKHIFITGGTGMIGRWLLQSYLVTQLENEMNLNCQLTVLTRNKEAFLKKYPLFNLPTLIRFIQGNLNQFALPNDCPNFTDIIHAADESGPIPTLELQTRMLSKMAEVTHVKRFILISSGLCADNNYDPRYHEYKERKLSNEYSVHVGLGPTAVEYKIARIYTVAGPYYPLDRSYALSQFLRSALKEKKVVLHQSDHPVLRTYLFGSDVAEWIYTALDRGSRGAVYEIAGQSTLSIPEVAQMVSRFFIVPLETIHEPTQPKSVYVPHTNDQAILKLGCEQKVSNSEAIHWTCEWAEACGRKFL